VGEEEICDTFDLWEFFGPDPFKGRFPPPRFGHVNLLDEFQAAQHIRNIIQPPHFGCKEHGKGNTTRLSPADREAGRDLENIHAYAVWVWLSLEGRERSNDAIIIILILMW